MPQTYDSVAGQSVERLAALSDGIFGVAMTLLLLDLHTPAKELIHSERDLLHALWAMGPAVLVYLLSFLTLGIFWVGQQTQLNHIERSDRHLTWLNMAFLFSVTVMPFSTRLLTDFINYRTALMAYWLNILVLGALVYACWAYACRVKLTRAEMPESVAAAVFRRIVVAQCLYAGGAALCVINTHVSIAVIVLIQLNYIVAPAYRRRAGKMEERD
jgi:uncharacterized membrane protein